jgi:hypothetical protein
MIGRAEVQLVEGIAAFNVTQLELALLAPNATYDIRLIESSVELPLRDASLPHPFIHQLLVD